MPILLGPSSLCCGGLVETGFLVGGGALVGFVALVGGGTVGLAVVDTVG